MFPRKTLINIVAGVAAVILGGVVALVPSFGNDGTDTGAPRSALEAGPDDHPYIYGTVDSKNEAGLALDIPSAVRRVLAGAGMEAVRSVEEIAPGSGPEAGLPRLRITITQDSLDGPAGVFAPWLSSVAQGAIGELVHSNQAAINQVLGHSETIVVLPSRTSTLDGNLGFVATDQHFSDSDLQDAEIIRRTNAVLDSFGLTVLEVRVLRPLGADLVVRASIPDGEDPDWTIDELLDAIGSNPRTVEGLYLEIDSTEGLPLLVSGSAYRTGLGIYWFTDGQDVRFNALHG